MKFSIPGIRAFRVVHGIVAGFLFAASLASSGQAPTKIHVTNSVIQPSVTRLGVNLGDQDYWDSGQILKNLVWRNPGFEGLRFRSILKCTSPTANTCMDDNQYSGQPTGYWAGGTYLILSGASAGKTGKVAASTKNPSSCSGCGQIIQFDQAINAASGDYFVVNNYFPGGGDSGWWDSAGGGGTISTELNDISPNSPGKQALLMSASGGGQSAGVTQYFDTFSGVSFIQMNGAFQVTFRAKGVGGNNQLTVNAQRLQAGNGGPWLNKTLTLTNAWQDYTLTFNATETGAAVGNIQLAFSAAGGSVELDDVSMVQTDSSTTNPTVFRDDVVNTLKALNPGTIRMMAAGAALGSDIPNQLAVPFARYRGGFNSSATNEPDVAYGIHEFLQLCQTVGADPWITIPTATTPQEMTDFINYLTGNGGDTYSAIRIARGQAEPWTTVFNKIHIELGNETWNGDFKGESISYPAYPQWANQVFGAARGVSTYDATKFDLVLDGWASVPGYNAQMLTYSTQHDSIDIAPYLLYSANNEPQSTMFGALMAEPEMFDSPGGEVYNNVLAAQAATRKTAVNVYETNMGSMIGNITQAQLDQLTPSVGAGIATAEHMLQMMRIGVQAQNAFALPQYKFLRSDQSLARLWGIVVDMGTTNRRRPQFLTEALANSVIGGTMMQTVQTGDPTWNQPLSSDGVQLNGAHYLQSFAFSSNGTNSLILFNLSQTTALPVSFTGPNVPSGTVQMSQITSANITDNNETSNTVQTVNKTLSGFDPNATFTLPPFSMTVLTANSSVTQVPTFSIPAGTYTSAQTVALSDGTLGAKIYFTTDGSTPTTSSKLYTGPIAVSASVTVNAMAVASGLTASPVASAAYVIGAQKAAATPVFSISAGSYTVAQTVAITDATSGATIYYTTDGSVPTTSSTKYTGPISVSATTTLSAIATATNSTTSAVAKAVYTITPTTQVVAAPVFSVPSGTYTTTQQVAMAAATPGATIHYTTDGSTPTATSASYTSAITVSTTAVVQAIATKPLFKPSPVASAHYTIAPGKITADPLFSVPAGTYKAAQDVTLSDATPRANIFYEVRTGTQHTALTKYTAPIKITGSATIVAFAVAPSTTRSAEISHAYIISTSTEPETDSPVFSVKPGTYATGQTVTLSDPTPGAEIFYTTNGVTPTSGSTKYSVPVKVTASMVVKAIAVAPGHTVSAEADGAYTIGSTLTPVGFQTGEMTLRGSSKLVGQTLRLTDGGESEIAAAWSAKRVPFSTFDLEFNFQLPASTADGFTLTLQNSGKGNWASGGNGAALGYQGISNSVAIKFDLFDSANKTEVSQTGLLINGVIPTTSVDMSSSGINLHTGHTFTARLTYDGTQITQTVTDTTTHAVFTHSYKVNIAGVLGSTTAYIGFTGSTGRYTSTQDILNWAFVSK